MVPFYNNADVLAECLASIAAQTFTDLDVIMVDDGSTDGGARIARERAAADPRFRLVQTGNGGPGKARNTGIEHARGEFLAFADGDDMLPPHAYEKLLHTLEGSGSDFVSGAVSRIGSGGVHPSALHERAIKGRKTGTHGTRAPELLYDISVWNKLFRRSFWDAHRLHYPEGVVWEDLQLMTRAHVLATAVDVIPDRIYYWRERAAGEFSITQNRTDIQNLRDRITALTAIDAFLREHAPARTARAHQRKALVNDLWLYVRDLCRVSDDYLDEYFDLVGSYLATVPRRVTASIPATHKLAYHLTGKRLRGPLLEYLTWLLDQRVVTIPVVRRFGRLQADLPFRTDRGLRIPRRAYRPHWRDLDPFVQVDTVTWQRGSLVIAGLAYVPSVDISKRRYTSKIVILRPRHRFRPPVVSLATSQRHPRATVLSGQEDYDYTWAGFRAEISSRWFRVAGRWLTGDWDCFILVRGHGVWRPARLHSPALGDAGRPGFLEPVPGLQVRPTWVGRHLHVGVLRTPARLAGFSRGPRGLAVDVELDLAGEAAAVPEAAGLVLAAEGGAAVHTVAAAVTGATGRTARIRGEIPVRLLSADRAADDQVPGVTAADGVRWDLQVKPSGLGRIRVTFPTGLAEARYLEWRAAAADGVTADGVTADGLTADGVTAGGVREVAVERSRYGNVTLAERAPRPVIDSHDWDATGQLLLRGSYLGPAEASLALVLRLLDGADSYAVGCARDGARFAATIPVDAMPTFGQPLPLRDGQWEILAQASGPGGPVTAVAYDHARLAEVPHKKVAVGAKLYAFTTAGTTRR